MRRRFRARRLRLVHAVVGAMMPAVPATALALTTGPSQTAADGVALQASMPSRDVAYHRTFTVSGRAPSSEAGQVVKLELAPAGSRDWHQIATARVRPD